MTIGVLIVSHGTLGQAMLDISVKTLDVCPLATRVLNVSFECDPDLIARNAEDMAKELDSGDGVLILTDLCGATPSNIACRLVRHHRAMVVAGLNLPMLMRVLNYPNLTLEEMAERAIDGGRQGIMLLPGTKEA
ncbi:PTS sugar transporter subunit IIA [Kaarinaea lacus]